MTNMLKMSSCTYKYDALEAEVKLKDVISCRHNRALLHRIKNNDPGITYLSLVSDSMVNGEGGYDDQDFIVREGDDLRWFGYFVGHNRCIQHLEIYHLPRDEDNVEAMFQGFQRSMAITSVEITGEEFLHEGFSAMNLPHVTKMEVLCPIGEGAQHFALGLRRCQSLREYHGDVTDAIAVSLSMLPNVEIIRVDLFEGFEDGRETSSEGEYATLGELLKNNSTLKELNLNNIVLGDEGLEALGSGLSNNRSLKVLTLCWGNVSDYGLKAFAPSLAENKDLFALSFYGCNIGDEGAKALGASLAHNRSLRVLNLSQNSISDEGLIALSSFVTSNRKLKGLHLSTNHIGDQGVEALVSALLLTPSRSRLRSLSLDGNTRISVQGFRAITRILRSRKCTLDDLNLDRIINIGEEGRKILGSGLSSNKSLLTLSLCNASINDIGMRNLVAGLVSNTSLQALDISSNTSITAAGLSHFKQYFEAPTCSLQFLGIYSMNIGEEGALALVDALTHNKSLKELKMWRDISGITRTGWKAFSKLLCDDTSPNNAYLSNHTLHRIGLDNDDFMNGVTPWLEVNKHSRSPSMAGKIKVLRGFSDLNMTPLLQWDLKLFPFAKDWFQHITPADEGWGDLTANIRSRELSVIYSFVRGMPVWVAVDCKKYLAEQLQRFGATKRRLQEEIQEIEERERRLVEGW
jgi:Ran GTPase-activating protein (RanGAP) involved in mRNA processing and transport